MVTKTIDNLKKKLYFKPKKLSLLNVGECQIKDKIYASCISGTRGQRGANMQGYNVFKQRENMRL